SDGIILLFKGRFDTEVIDNVSRVLMQNTLYNDSLGDEGKTFFHVAIEMFQNMARHSKKTDGKQNGFFMVQLKDNKFSIMTKNCILAEDVDNINLLFGVMENLSPDELAEYYKKQLRQSTMNDENNAGVGLIDIMRCTNGNLTKFVSRKENDLELVLTATVNI
ncbi:MAG: SiaB family protein kinase, partial [Crocinitomicaceae bacterium]